MAHSLGYPTDINSEPNRKERSQEKQRSSIDMAVKMKKQACLCKHDSYINLQ